MLVSEGHYFRSTTHDGQGVEGFTKSDMPGHDLIRLQVASAFHLQSPTSQQEKSSYKLQLEAEVRNLCPYCLTPGSSLEQLEESVYTQYLNHSNQPQRKQEEKDPLKEAWSIFLPTLLTHSDSILDQALENVRSKRQIQIQRGTCHLLALVQETDQRLESQRDPPHLEFNAQHADKLRVRLENCEGTFKALIGLQNNYSTQTPLFKDNWSHTHLEWLVQVE